MNNRRKSFEGRKLHELSFSTEQTDLSQFNKTINPRFERSSNRKNSTKLLLFKQSQKKQETIEEVDQRNKKRLSHNNLNSQNQREKFNSQYINLEADQVHNVIEKLIIEKCNERMTNNSKKQKTEKNQKQKNKTKKKKENLTIETKKKYSLKLQSSENNKQNKQDKNIEEIVVKLKEEKFRYKKEFQKIFIRCRALQQIVHQNIDRTRQINQLRCTVSTLKNQYAKSCKQVKKLKEENKKIKENKKRKKYTQENSISLLSETDTLKFSKSFIEENENMRK